MSVDSTMSFYRLPEFSSLQQSFQPIKGVTAFCGDSSQKGYLAGDRSVRLCITKRRTIQFYNLFDSSISEPRELNLPNGALVVTRWDNVVCVADGNDFNLIDTRVGRMIPVLPVVQSAPSGSNSLVLKPVCIPIAGDEFLLASATSSGQTAIGIFCTGSGDPVRGTLQWSSYPKALAVEYPYVAALLRGNVIEVHNILDQKLAQTIRFEPTLELRTLIQGPGMAVWMSTLAKVLNQRQHNEDQQRPDSERSQQEANRIPSVLARVLIAGKDSVSALVTTPLVLHADSLLQKGRVEEALLLSEKTTATMSSENLHRERLQIELDYIYQKSGLIYLSETLFDDGFGLLQRGKLDPRALISMFPDVLQKPDLMSHVSLFQGIHNQVVQLGTVPSIIEKTMSKSGSKQEAEFGEMLLKNAKDIFLQYLERYRNGYTARKGYFDPRIEATDTALLGLWVDNEDDASLRRLLESDNSCSEELSEQKLQRAGKHFALSIWHKVRRNYKLTLSIWKRLFLGELVDKAFDIELKDMAMLVLSLQDIMLIEKYGWWIVEQDEAIGLKIFMPGDPKRAAMFDPDRVIAKLKSKISQQGFLNYMEYVVMQRKSESAVHHNILIQMYAENIARLVADPVSFARHTEVVEGFIKSQEEYLLGLIRSRTARATDSLSAVHSHSTFISYLQLHSKSEPISAYRYKLCQLLQSSKLYDASEVLSEIDLIPELKIEKAILLSRLSRHTDCIKIMAVELKDYKGVEIFCLNAGVFRSPRRGAKTSVNENAPSKDSIADIERKKNLFMILLQEYLNMAQDQGGMALTLQLLDSQSSYLDLSEVIHLLPPFWSVELLQQYLVRSLRRSYHDYKEVQVAKGLSLGENLCISEELYKLYETQGPVKITADDICYICGTAVADAVFIRTVDMKIIHLHCGSSTQ
ncbi:transforming growth factor, beta receptor associated protein 1 [Mortierella sp. AM989]|nr:transforming growth factor, beta receptor associated protein 1 [Mortierella sp. AM989]